MSRGAFFHLECERNHCDCRPLPKHLLAPDTSENVIQSDDDSDEDDSSSSSSSAAHRSEFSLEDVFVVGNGHRLVLFLTSFSGWKVVEVPMRFFFFPFV